MTKNELAMCVQDMEGEGGRVVGVGEQGVGVKDLGTDEFTSLSK